MKQTSAALTFLLAQYRAIFKRAYIKGIASAVLLTAGLAAGAAQAADTLYFEGSSGNWELNSGTSTNTNAMIAAHLGGNSYAEVEGVTTTGAILSGGIFHIGGAATAENYLEKIQSGTAVGGYANAKTGDMEATDNHIYVAGSGTVTAGDGTPSSRGLIYGAYVTAQDGLAKATANSVIVQKDKAQVSTAAADDGYIGGRAQGAAGATVESNKVSITGYDGSLQVVNASDNEYDVIGGLALNNEDNSTGTYQANQNIVDLQYIKVTDAGAANKGFNITGGLVAPDGDAAYTVVAQGNQVTVANSDLATTNSGKLTVKIVGGNSASALANGTVTLKDNTVTLDNTSVTKSGGYSGSFLIAGGATTGLDDTLNQSKNITATGNKVELKATTAKSIGADIIAGASITNVAQGANSVTLTATGNSVTVGNNVTVSTDEGLAGAYISASGSALNSVDASNNSVEIKGTVHGDVAAFMLDDKDGTVAAGVLDASNNVVTLANGAKVDSGSIIAGEGPGSAINIESGSTYTANGSTNALISDIINIDGAIVVEQNKSLDIKGYYKDGDPDATTFNANLTTVKDDAHIINSGTINVYGKMVVEDEAVLTAGADAAAIIINGADTYQNAQNDEDVVAGAGFGHLVIAKDTLDGYLKGETNSGALILSNATLEFSGTEEIDLAKDFTLSGGDTSKSGSGVITVSGSTIKGEYLKVSDKLTNVQASHELLLEATNLTLGSNTYQGTDSFGFSGATTQNLTLQASGAFTLADDITLEAVTGTEDNYAASTGSITAQSVVISGVYLFFVGF